MADFNMIEVKTEELSVHEQVNKKCRYVVVFNPHPTDNVFLGRGAAQFRFIGIRRSVEGR